MTPQRFLLPIALLAFAACGGGALGTTKASGGSQAMDASEARKATNDLLTLEGVQASGTALPTWAPTPEGTSMAFTPGTAAACVTKDAPYTDGSGFTHVVSHYACNGPQGGSLSGTIESIFKNNDYTLIYNLTAAFGTLTWDYTGSRILALNPSAKTSAITTAITVVAKNSGTTLATENHSASWTADWNTAGTYKLWGSFTVARSGQDTLTGSVASAAPLVWTTGCCYPTSGTLSLARGSQSAQVSFTTPCGQVILTLPGSSDANVSLPPC